MFRLSTKSKYGLKACFSLAEKGALMSISEIAESTGVSISYLEQLFIKLKKAKIVEATRGSQGGYVLTHKPNELTIGMVMRALEGDVSVAACTTSACKNSGKCPTRSIFKRLNDGIEKMVDEITVQDMLDDYRNHNRDIEEE